MTTDFGKSLTTSLLLHGCIVLLLCVNLVLSPGVPLEIRDAIRVDIVGLPDKMPEQAKIIEAPAAEKPVAEPTPAAKPVEKKEALPVKMEPPKAKAAPKVDLAKSQKKALDQLKAMQAIEKIKDEVSLEQKKQASRVIKGSQISKGNSLTGLEKIDYDRYGDLMRSHLLQNWSLPQWLADAELKAQALVMLDENGNVTHKQILKSSGNSVFDSNVLEAIAKSSPFPAPSPRLRSTLATQGAVFNFPVE